MKTVCHFKTKEEGESEGRQNVFLFLIYKTVIQMKSRLSYQLGLNPVMFKNGEITEMGKDYKYKTTNKQTNKKRKITMSVVLCRASTNVGLSKVH